MYVSINCALAVLVTLGGRRSLVRFVHGSEGENRLVQYLFAEQGYNPLVRPTQHSNETVVVSFGLLLVQLIHVRMCERKRSIARVRFSFFFLRLGLRKRTDYEDQHLAAYEVVSRNVEDDR